jgi:hypothetical protein
MRRFFFLLCCAALWSFVCCGSTWAQEPDATPIHPFKKLLYQRIGWAWYAKVQANSQKIRYGTIRIGLTASREGKILSLRVLSNTSNQVLAKVSLSAIQSVKIPPVPPNLLTHGRFEDEISFTVFPNPPTKST